MKSLKLFFLLISFCYIITSCKKNSKSEGNYIPPMPNDIEFAKQKVAITVLTAEIRKNYNNHENYFKRAAIYFKLNDIENAKADINEALSLNANKSEYRLLKSEIFRKEVKFAKALEEAKLAEILGLKSPELYTILGDLFQKNNQISEAKKYLKYAQEIAPNNGEVYYYTALLNTKLGDTTAALENLNLAKKLKPRFTDTYKRLSEIYTQQGNTDMAKALTEDLAKLYPDDPENATILAKIYQKRLNIDSAMIFYKKALTLKPNLYQVSYDAGMLSLRYNYLDDAIQFFENTYKYAPKTPFINTSLGICYEKKGDSDKAYEYYTIAFARNRSDYKAIEGIKRIEEKMYIVDNSQITIETIEPTKAIINKPKIDTTRIRLTEIQPKKISSPKRDSANQKLQIPSKFSIPTIK